MTKKSFRTTLFCATMLMGVMPSHAFAEGAAPSSTADDSDETPSSTAGGDSNAIVVTATRRATTLQDAPINITAIGSQELAAQHIDDVKSLSAFTPGMTVIDTGANGAGDIILRGISSSDTSASGTTANSALGVYLGEVPLYLDFKLIDIQRVEVLEGPQGTLYGLGTLAGAVRYIPNRPNTDTFSIDVHGRAFGESHSGQVGLDGDITVNIPIIQDHVAFRTATGYYHNPGFIDYNYVLKQPGISDPQPVRGPTAADGSFGTTAQQEANFNKVADANFEHTFSTRNQLLLEANSNLKVFLTWAHQDTTTDGRQANQAGVLGTGPYESAKRYLEPVNRKADLFSAEFNVNLFDFADLVATTAFTNQRILRSADNTDLLLDLNYGYEAFPNFSSYNTSETHYRQFNEEIRLVSTHGGPFNWVIGGFYNNRRSDSQYHEVVPGFGEYFSIPRPDDVEYISFVTTRTKEKAVYGEGTFHITPKWQITGGIRYFGYDAFINGGTDTPMYGGGLSRVPYPLVTPWQDNFAPTRVHGGDASDSGVVWKANTSYKFSDDLLAYFTYSTGYRTGNANRVAPCILPLLPGQNVCALPDELFYGPDKTANAELGVRGTLLDRRLHFTADVYHIDWTGIQVPSQTVNGAVGIIKNAGKAVSQGFDLAVQFKVTPNFVLQGTYAYDDAHLTQDAPGLVVSDGVSLPAFSGDRLPGSTKNSGSAQATYTYPLANGDDIRFNWTTTFTGDIYSRVGLRGNGEVIPGYTVHSASITYEADKFSVSLFADNLFDKYAITAIQNDLSSYNRVRTDFGQLPSEGVVERYYSHAVLTPRRFGVDIRFHY